MTAADDHAASPPRVVVGYDNSEPSERALDRAADEAALRGAALEILCGWPWELLPPASETDRSTLFQRSRRLVDRAADRAGERHPGLSVIPSMTSEAAADALVRCGRSAALTVVGTRGHGGFAGLLLGSVSLRVAALTRSPLLVVRGPVGHVRGQVLLGVESDADTEAVSFAFEEAQRRGAELRVLHAWEFSPDPDDVQRTAAAESLSRFAVSALREKYPEVAVRTDSEQGPAGRVLVRASAEADLVVLAVHRRKHRIGMQLGPVTHTVLHHADCPVVLVPGDH